MASLQPNNYQATTPATADQLLPSIKDLNLSSENLIRIGKVASIVDILVVIEAVKLMPPLDLDTILFKSDGQPVGQVYDVFGAVTEPHYSVKFSSPEKILEKDIRPELDIYFLAQTDVKVTRFAFVDELKKIKGTDASDNEDNSDDDD